MKRLGLLILLFTFGEAALSKALGGHVPDWFVQQFTKSPLDLGGFSLAASYYFVMVLEMITATSLALALARERFVSPALFLAQATFSVLMIGQRLTHKYDDAFYLMASAFIVFFFSRSFQRAT